MNAEFEHLLSDPISHQVIIQAFPYIGKALEGCVCLWWGGGWGSKVCTKPCRRPLVVVVEGSD